MTCSGCPAIALLPSLNSMYTIPRKHYTVQPQLRETWYNAKMYDWLEQIYTYLQVCYIFPITTEKGKNKLIKRKEEDMIYQRNLSPSSSQEHVPEKLPTCCISCYLNWWHLLSEHQLPFEWLSQPSKSHAELSHYLLRPLVWIDKSHQLQTGRSSACFQSRQKDHRPANRLTQSSTIQHSKRNHFSQFSVMYSCLLKLASPNTPINVYNGKLRLSDRSDRVRFGFGFNIRWDSYSGRS